MTSYFPDWATESEHNAHERVEQLEAEIERLRAALVKVRDKAGSHTVSTHTMGREDDPGFSGIYAVADNALASSE